MTTYFFVKLVHLAAMAMWFGGGATFPRDLRLSLAQGAPALPGLVDRGNRIATIMRFVGPLTILTGVAMIFLGGGFKMMPKRIHIGLALGIVAAIVAAVGVGGTWTKIAKAAQAGDVAAAQAAAKKFPMFFGIEHGLLTIILVLMVLKF